MRDSFQNNKKAGQNKNKNMENGQKSGIRNKALRRAIDLGKTTDPERATNPE